MRHFTLTEFQCRHCGVEHMDPSFLLRVDDLRERYGKPLVITSGYRCAVYNATVSTTGKTGPHTTGHAADFAVAGKDALVLVQLALQLGFTGIGVNQKGAGRFIHLDDLPASIGCPRPTIWSY